MRLLAVLATLTGVVALVALPYTVVVTMPATATPLPWSKFSEMAQDAVGAYPGACPSAGQVHEVLAAKIVHDGVTYGYFTSEEGRWVLAELGKDGTPVKIYSGQQLPAPDHDTIKVTESHPYSEARDGQGPCAVLYPEKA